MNSFEWLKKQAKIYEVEGKHAEAVCCEQLVNLVNCYEVDQGWYEERIKELEQQVEDLQGELEQLRVDRHEVQARTPEQTKKVTR